ncbi:MAG: HAD family hydrolase [Pirellulaceae bacterium]
MKPIATDLVALIEPIPDIRVVIFDVYGTLVVSGTGDVGSTDASSHAQALDASMRSFGLTSALSADEALRRQRDLIAERHQRSVSTGVDHGEVDIVQVWIDWFAALGICDDCDTETAIAFAVDFESRSNPTCEMPGAADAIVELANKGYSLGIVSNAQFFTHQMLDRCLGGGVIGLFDRDLVYFSYRFGQSKPGTIMFDRLIELLGGRGLSPHEALYVGNDMLNDVATASRLGMRTALFAGDARSLRLREGDERVKGVRPDVILTHLNQLQAVCRGR